LDLSSNYVGGDSGFSAVLQLIEVSPDLEEINFSNNFCCRRTSISYAPLQRNILR